LKRPDARTTANSGVKEGAGRHKKILHLGKSDNVRIAEVPKQRKEGKAGTALVRMTRWCDQKAPSV